MSSVAAILPRCFKCTVSQLFDSGQGENKSQTIETIKWVALIAFNGYTMWCNPTIWTIAVIAGGTLARDLVEPYITERIGGIYASVIPPLYFVLLKTDENALMFMQAVLAGAHLGYNYCKLFSKQD